MKTCLLTALLLVTSVLAAEPELKSIFTGTDLSGWKKPGQPDCWTARDGVLYLKNNEKKKGDILQTEKSYRNFMCELEFKFGEGTIDSGLFIRNKKEQIQIGISGSLKRDMTASPYIPGKGYPVEAKGVKELLRMDDWNTLKVRAAGGAYTSWLNGKEVMNYSSASAVEEGPLGFQLHGGRVMSISFRNIKVAELPD